jgi:type IV pilus assembly protein PilB
VSNWLLFQGVEKSASDIHLSLEQNEVKLRLRIDGELRDIQSPPKQLFLPLVSRLKLLSGLDISVSKIPQDGRFSYRVKNQEVNVRTSTIPTIYGEKVVLRLHVQKGFGLTLGDLDLDERERAKIERECIRPNGMLLATGPTGSGKTTLLYAILSRLNNPDINIITLEDPVESRLEGVTQIQLNRKAGMTFASGLRSILRQDPDIILVGEIRDNETARIAIDAAMTGHKVLSTLHTNDAPGAVTRFIELGVDPFTLCSTLQLVIAQRLVRKICPHCIEDYPAPDNAMQEMGLPDAPLHFFRGRGCPRCDGAGFKGRLGVFEILEINEAMQSYIQQGLSSSAIKQRVVESGHMRTLSMDARDKVLRGRTTFEEYRTVAT